MNWGQARYTAAAALFVVTYLYLIRFRSYHRCHPGPVGWAGLLGRQGKEGTGSPHELSALPPADRVPQNPTDERVKM